MRRVIVAHGWDGTPDTGWFPWLKKELEEKGFEVVIPQLPNPENPSIQTWVPALAAAVGTPDEQTYFIGHSMGCQTIARYLETLPEGQRVGGAVFVAGFFGPLIGLEDDASVHETDRLWASTPIDLEKIKSHLPRSVAIFSDNDQWVPLSNQETFKEQLGSEVILLHDQAHFNEGAGFKELPIILEKLLEIAS